MSGWMSSEDCTECGSKDSLEIWSENRPHDQVGGICLECGFSYKTIDEQMSLEEVNDEREAFGLEPLTELKKKLTELENAE